MGRSAQQGVILGCLCSGVHVYTQKAALSCQPANASSAQ